MRKLRRILALALAAVAVLGIALAASGWLYLLRGVAIPGPRIGNALPLDELAHASTVSFLLFVCVWGIAGLLLGLVGRAAGAERLRAAFSLALAIAGWSFLASGLSIAVVRQISAHAAFRDAATLRAVYLPAALAGLGGALVGRARPVHRSRAPFVLSWLVAAAGLLGILDAILPQHGRTLLDELAPERVHPLTSALVAPLGLALLVIARGLGRRKRRAWRIGVALVAASTALNLLHSFGYGALATGLLTLALVARRQTFDAPGDPESDGRRILVRALLFFGAIYAYGFLALWVNRLTADQPFTLSFSLRETSRALLGLELSGSAHLAGGFGEWFPLSILIAGVGAVVLLLSAWLAPWRHRVRQGTRDRDLARALIDAWGVDTLAPFVLRADKSYFFCAGERAFLAYRVVGGVAIMSGDPVGPPELFGELVDDFIAFAHARDWRIAILGVGERCLDLYRARGLHALYHGDEAVLDVGSFSLDGRAIRKVRQSVHRLEKAGFRARCLHPRKIGPELRKELEAVARAWRGAEPERGFVMALDALFRLEDEDALFVIGYGPDGAPQGFLHFAVSRAGHALSLSSMPRLRTTPNGFNEWLVCEAVAWARERGYGRISLNFAPFAALLAPEAELSALQRVERRALLALKGHFQLDNLLLFNRKFFPSWERRFVVYERRLDLPRVGIAALVAESYLPFGARR